MDRPWLTIAIYLISVMLTAESLLRIYVEWFGEKMGEGEGKWRKPWGCVLCMAFHIFLLLLLSSYFMGETYWFALATIFIGGRMTLLLHRFFVTVEDGSFFNVHVENINLQVEDENGPLNPDKKAS